MSKTKEKKKHPVDISKLGVKEFRQRMFVRKSNMLFGSEYTYVDDLPEQIEAMPGFTNWETFGELWDVYWVGLDPRTMSWVCGRHNSPMRQLVLPLRLLPIDERSGRMEETYVDRADVQKLKVPNKHIEESDEDRIISEALTGKVVIDEPDEDKAIRAIEATLAALTAQLATLKK